MENQILDADQAMPEVRHGHHARVVCWYVLLVLLFFLAALITVTTYWAGTTFGVGLNEIIHTLTSPLQGTSMDTIRPALQTCLPPLAAVLAAAAVFIVWDCRLRARITAAPEENTALAHRRRVRNRVVSGVGVGLLACSLLYANARYDIIGYLANLKTTTMLYENEYVDPASASITPEGTAKNVICIYLESMENTYASVADGGAQAINYIPNLTALAAENVSFSNTEKLGGLHSAYGTGWTMGALFASTSGVPFAFPVGGNDMQKQAQFASGITTLGDFLAARGYTQEFLCGSDATFAGRRTYYQQHGNYNIYDYYTAIQNGDIAPGYQVWWGFEDQILYRIARKELLRLAAARQPFNFTMLTADTHHIDGYVCSLCRDDYPEQTANVVACADRQAAAFIAWCRQQDFFDNTVIVVMGDHPRMDTSLVSDVKPADRMVYNCFINASFDSQPRTVNRDATPMDLFPTILSSMGYSIDGDRLGLGTDLFSDRKTLAEELGYAKFNRELARKSDYYVANFAPELLALAAAQSAASASALSASSAVSTAP